MGYAPDWNKGSMKKSGATPATHGVTSRELFHGAKTVQKFEDGGAVYKEGVDYANPVAAKSEPVELNIRGEKVGKYEGNDEIAKYRMNMTDGVGGKSLRYKDQPKPQYDSIDAIIADKATKDEPSSEPAETEKPKANTGSRPRARIPKMPAYDPGDTARGMGGYMAKDLGMPARMANFTSAGDYVSATDVAAADFMKRRAKAK